MTRFRWWLGIALVAGVAFFACGGPSGDGSGATSDDGPDASEPSSDGGGSTSADGGGGADGRAADSGGSSDGATDGAANGGDGGRDGGGGSDGSATDGGASDGSVTLGSFGDAGAVTDLPGTAFAVQTDGTSIYVGGFTNGLWTIEKRSVSDGALAAGFADGGVATRPSAGQSQVNAIALDSTYLYAGGYELVTGLDDQWIVEKRDLATGTPVAGFGTNGTISNNITNFLDHVEALAVDNGYLYVGGWSNPSTGGASWRIEKHDATTGAIVNAFGTNGAIVVPNTPSGDTKLKAMLVTGGYVYAGGWTPQLGGSYMWRIEKRDVTTGALDPGFGTSGVVFENLSAGDDFILALATDGTSLYAAGFSLYNNMPDHQWRIEKRSLVDGALDGTFNGGNGISENPSATDDDVNGLVFAAPYLYAIGYDHVTAFTNDTEWRVEKRLASTGALVPGFGDGGVFTHSTSTYADLAYAGTAAATRLFVVGTSTPNATPAQVLRIEAMPQ
jgi:hypothetical protein